MTRQEQFIREHKKFHQKIVFSQIGLFLALLIIWELAAVVGAIDSFFFCSPSIVVRCFVRMLLEEELFMHLGYSLLEILVSFLLILLISFACAVVLWYFPAVSRVLEPFLVVLNSLPKSALAPLFIVWIGTGVRTIIVAGISVALFGSIISLYSGFKETDAEKILLIETWAVISWMYYVR